MKVAEEANTFNGWVEEYLSHLAVERALSRNTISAYRRDLARFAHFLEEREIRLPELSHADMDQFAAEMRQRKPERAPLSEASIARAIVAIRNFSAFIAKESKAINPIQQYRPPRIPKRLPKALTVENMVALIEASQNESETITLRDSALIELLYATGARVSEAVNLSVNDVVKVMNAETSDGVISIRLLGKGNKERVVPLGSYAQRALDQYLVRLRPQLAKDRRSSALFLNHHGGKLSRQSAWQIIHDAAE